MNGSAPLEPDLWDDSIDPGEDFYLHVNARWLAANPIPSDQGTWGAAAEIDHRNKEIIHRLLAEAGQAGPDADHVTRIAGDFFASGMDEAAIEAAGVGPIQGILGRIEAVASAADVRTLVLDLHRLGIGPFFELQAEADFADASVYMGYLGEAGLGLPEKGYYLNDDDRSAAIRESYVAHIAAQLRNLGEDEAEAAGRATAVLAWERRLAVVSLSPEERRDPTRTFNRRTLEELDAEAPGWRLGAFLTELGVTGGTLCVNNPPFFAELDRALADTPLDSVRAGIRWHVIRTCAQSLSSSFEIEHFGFYGRLLGGQREQQPRWKRIVAAAGNDIGEAVSQLFVRETFPPEAKARIEELVGHLLHAMGRAIRDNGWMTEATRTEALAKLATFRAKIGYPDRWRDYAALELDRSSYLGNRLAAASFELRRQLGRIGHPVDPDEWMLPPHVVNAYYHPLRNEIVFAAGILQPPFFHADADDAVVYGGIGTIIGHEITHGFDDEGSRFDADGHLRNWWTEEDRQEFERRADVLVEQFNAYQVLDDVHVNGRLTLGENIADLGGLLIALDALHEAIGPDAPLVDGLTPDQRFFLSYATIWRTAYTEAAARIRANVDPHSPARYRTNGPISNAQAFAAAFGIPEGAPMARPAGERAEIW